MATYEEIYGKRVDVLASDPTLTAANEGQVWYNSTTGTLRGVVSFAAWSSTNPMTATSNGGFSFGHTQNAVTAAGGYGPGTNFSNKAEEYVVGSTAINVKTLTQS